MPEGHLALFRGSHRRAPSSPREPASLSGGPAAPLHPGRCSRRWMGPGTRRGRGGSPGAVALALVASLAACGGEAEWEIRGVAWEMASDTLGDTVVVRTLSGSVRGGGVLAPVFLVGEMEGPPELSFGNIRALAVGPGGKIHLLDSQGPALRVYGADGAYLQTVGRPGSGPGEYRQPDGGLAVLSDGRILLRDPGNQRISVYSPEGEGLDTWLIRGGFNTGRPLHVDRQERIWYMLLLDPRADVADWRMGLVRFDRQGTPLDTVAAPRTDYQAPRLEARREGSVNINNVPFSPGFTWSVTADGGWLTGLSTRYRVEVERSDGTVLRLERVHDPVAVHPAERTAAEARTTRNMRSNVPDWRWNGPPIPEVKPPFRDLVPASNGRIWVVLHGPGRLVAEARPDPQGGEEEPAVWTEQVRFDVFEADGRYLGVVDAPDGLSLFPQPVIRGDTVWAVLRDDLDVQRVGRFQVEWADGGSAGGS